MGTGDLGLVASVEEESAGSFEVGSFDFGKDISSGGGGGVLGR